MLQGYDVIHAGNALAAYPLFFFRKHIAATVVHDMHGHSSEYRMKLTSERHRSKTAFLYLQSLILEEVTIHRADYHLVVSRPLRQKLLSHGIPAGRTLLLRNGVDTELFNPASDSNNSSFTVCYAGDFQAWQGIDMLIEAYRLCRDLDAKFKIIGFRQTADDLRWKEKIQKILQPHVELVDRLPQKELIGHLNGADLLVIPRRRHTATEVAMPTKFAEYIALSKPVIVTDVDETARFVRRHRCGLVSSPTASGLAHTIRRARSLGKERLRDMGCRGRRLAESTFSWEVICRTYFDFLAAMEGAAPH
jgi:glycosyltransferase involved in cell wall biosynthesis